MLRIALRPARQAQLASHYIIFLLVALLLPSCGNEPGGNSPRGGNAPADADLRHQLLRILSEKKARVGVAVANLEDAGDTLSINGDEHFALMSVAKFPQALLLLQLSDRNEWDRTQPIAFGPKDLEQRTGSTIRTDHPQASFRLLLPEVLRYMIGQSDNISANKVFAIEGGPKAVEAYVHGLGVRDISIATDYAHMNPDSPMQNRGTPRALVQLLSKFHRRELLSDSSYKLLWTAMVEATSGANRLKGGLPEGTLIGHKTGTSNTDERTGVTPAFNDAGIIRLPDGRYYAIAVLVGDSREGDKGNAELIASISNAVYGYFNKKR